MADKFTSCVLPQDATPDEINKGMLDLLKKANQVHTDLTESATAQTEALATVDKTLTDKIDGLDFTALKDVNGYQKLPSGLIMQWGVYSGVLVHGTSYTVTFPISFPTACLTVLPSVFQNSLISTTTSLGFFKVMTKQKTDFTGQWGWTAGGSAQTDFNYLAIGY